MFTSFQYAETKELMNVFLKTTAKCFHPALISMINMLKLTVSLPHLSLQISSRFLSGKYHCSYKKLAWLIKFPDYFLKRLQKHFILTINLSNFLNTGHKMHRLIKQNHAFQKKASQFLLPSLKKYITHKPDDMANPQLELALRKCLRKLILKVYLDLN